jgi:hypothetical protein
VIRLITYSIRVFDGLFASSFRNLCNHYSFETSPVEALTVMRVTHRILTVFAIKVTVLSSARSKSGNELSISFLKDS